MPMSCMSVATCRRPTPKPSRRRYRQSPRAEVRVLQMELVDPPHQLQVGFRNRTRRMYTPVRFSDNSSLLTLHR